MKSSVLLLAFWLAACAPTLYPKTTGPTREMPEIGAFVVRLGQDTVSVERFTRTGRVTQGDAIDRSPETRVIHYSFAVDQRGDIMELEATIRYPSSGPAAPPAWRTLVSRTSGGFNVLVQEGDSVHKAVTHASADLIPLFDRSLALYELLTTRYRSARKDVLIVPILDFSDFTSYRNSLRALGADSVVIPLIFPLGEHVRVDSAGRILGISGLATSYKWLTERVNDLDIPALERSFAERDAQHTGVGRLSGRDTSRAEIGAAAISVDYGRPARRGRAIFGSLVPWDKVWRTGADLATTFSTDRELEFNSLKVPVGTYSLYTVPSPDGWVLVFNRQTGQSGLEYHAEQDFGRTPMTVASGAPPVERLTIRVIREGDGGGVLEVAWDTLVARARFTVMDVRP